jgi:DNA-binding PadR family transcriptional regulator
MGRGRWYGRPPWAEGPPFAGGHWHGGRRMRRGEIRSALLSVLAEGPGHGYELIGRLDAKTGGVWRPSPGSVYPTLQLLEDEGVVRSETREGKRIYELTDTGQAEVAARTEAGEGPPWQVVGDEGVAVLRATVFQLHAAARQVAHAGTPELVDRAVRILGDARKELYLLLAGD